MSGGYSVYNVSSKGKISLKSNTHKATVSNSVINVDANTTTDLQEDIDYTDLSNSTIPIDTQTITNLDDDEEETQPFTMVPDLGDSDYAALGEKFIKSLEKKLAGIGVEKATEYFIKLFGDDVLNSLIHNWFSQKTITFTKGAIVKAKTFFSTTLGCFVTGDGGTSVFSGARETVIKLFPKVNLAGNIQNLITNKSTEQLAVLADKFAAQAVKRGTIDASYQATYSKILQEGGFERIAGSAEKAYAITNTGILTSGAKNGIFYFLAAESMSFIKGWKETGTLAGGWKKMLQDSPKNIAEATGAAVGYIAGSAIGAAIGGLIGGPAGAYLGQKIGAFVGQIVGSWAAGVIFDHWDDIKEFGSTFVENTKNLCSSIWHGIFG